MWHHLEPPLVEMSGLCSVYVYECIPLPFSAVSVLWMVAAPWAREARDDAQWEIIT